MVAFRSWTPRRATEPAADDDAALARRVAGGDGAALDALYRRDAGAVYRYVLALAFADRPGGFDAARGPLSAYLAGMARHHLMAQWRERPVEANDSDETGAHGAEEVTPESLLVRRQSTDALWAALAALSWPQREALVLVDLQQRPYSETAAIAGIELNTLRTRLHRARLRLAQALQAGVPFTNTTTGAAA